MLLVGSAIACSSSDRVVPETTRVATPGNAPALAAARCYTGQGSILGRRPGDPGISPSTPPSWIRLDAPSSGDRGTALLLDGDGSSLNAEWRGLGPGVVVVSGFNDFLRVELRLSTSSSRAAGRGIATSDATQERDSAGVLRDYRREFTVATVATQCTGMPKPAAP